MTDSTEQRVQGLPIGWGPLHGESSDERPLSPRPRVGEPTTRDQLYDWMCEHADVCEYAERCAAQPFGPAARCYMQVERARRDESAHALTDRDDAACIAETAGTQAGNMIEREEDLDA